MVITCKNLSCVCETFTEFSNFFVNFDVFFVNFFCDQFRIKAEEIMLFMWYHVAQRGAHYSKPIKTSKIKLFDKLVSSLLVIFAESSILNVWLDSDCISDYCFDISFNRGKTSSRVRTVSAHIQILLMKSLRFATLKTF